MKLLIKLAVLSISLLSANVYSAEVNIRPFKADSWQHILQAHPNQPMLVIMWSVTCVSCLEEMQLIRQIQKIQQQKVPLSIVMISVDGPEFYQEMAQMIDKGGLTNIPQWGFVEDNSAALRYVIDKRWYGELPRTYFLDSEHRQTGISGVLSLEKYNAMIARQSGINLKRK